MIDLLNVRKGKVLLMAKAVLPESQFVAFRKLVLDEFGEKGLEGELKQLFKQ